MEGLVLFPAVVCKAPAAMVFCAAPAVLLVTFTTIVHPPAGIEVPFARVKLPAPAAAVTPVQVPVLPAVWIVIPVGKVSVRRLVRVMATAFVLPIVIVRLVLPPLARSLTVKALLIVGFARTVRTELSDAEAPPVVAVAVLVTVPAEAKETGPATQ